MKRCAAPAWPAAAVARQLGHRAKPAWLFSPEGKGARSFVACDPVEVVGGQSLADLESAWERARANWGTELAGVPIGLGHLSYDLGRRFLRLRSRPPGNAPSPWPEIEFRFYDALWTRADDGEAEIWACNDEAAAALAAKLTGVPHAPGPFQLTPLSSCEPPLRHLRAVGRVLAYLAAGDVYQVNLARRLEARITETDPIGLALFARLCVDAPAPHAIWLGDPQRGRALVGNSPERFLRVDTQRRIETEPIKGTRPRDPAAGPQEIAAGLAELVASSKDRAEHVMIVDLERNDLGRICEVGSIEVRDALRGLVLPRVLHLVSTISGRLRPDVGLGDILCATFPGGSITGAPKLRAMEIIDELEAAPRGPYTGATGWLGAAGDLDLAIAIRTALCERNQISLWVGGGIVADSEPAAELAETEVKAQAFAALAGI